MSEREVPVYDGRHKKIGRVTDVRESHGGIEMTIELDDGVHLEAHQPLSGWRVLKKAQIHDVSIDSQPNAWGEQIHLLSRDE